PNIVATSQQSRFHTETLETLSKEIDLKSVNISVNQLELLVDAHLRLKENVKYGFVGPNGTGKSVLLKCLAEDILIGIPQNLQILHVTQLESENRDITVLEEILSSDSESTLILEENEMLNTVMGNNQLSIAGSELNIVLHKISIMRSKENLRKLNAIATKRSGARGLDARKKLVEAERQHEYLINQDPNEAITPDISNEMVTDILTKATMINREAQIAKASKILKGLGFNNDQLQSKVSNFSGGWRMRIALGKALFMEPNILLLDEPTNHLDLPAILWLQEYISNYTDDMTVVIVSHDREFLNNVTEETIILKDKTLRYHAGNFQDYEKNTEEQRIRKQNLLDNNEKRKKNIIASIQQNVKRAKATGDDKRLGQVASRTKKLERLGMEKTEDGKRFKVSNRPGYYLDLREQIVVEQKIKTNGIFIPDPAPLRSTGGPFLSLENVSFRYNKDSPFVLKNITLNLTPNSRVAFLGVNGSGKSTLLDVLTGKIQPTTGQVQRNPLLRVGYFTQHVVDALDMELTPVELLQQKDSSLSEQVCRQHLGSVGIGGLGNRAIKHLSGGQRSRVVLAMILYDQPHVLILDEITNHLDMGTIDILVEGLTGFTGCLVLVSHDFWFLKQLMEPVLADDQSDDEGAENDTFHDIFSLKAGTLKRWDSGLDSYIESTLKKVQKQMSL
ncbi:P-loop containing nucleoside triphosphate hydrolase protein, partial [Cunninghamella echinulata]